MVTFSHEDVVGVFSDAEKEVVDAGYTFISDGTWYTKGTEAVIFFNMTVGPSIPRNGEGMSVLQTVEAYVEGGEQNYSGLFGGWRHGVEGLEDGWDEEGCGYDEFDIYKDGVLVRKATCADQGDNDDKE
jgi:hypothetical protein